MRMGLQEVPNLVESPCIAYLFCSQLDIELYHCDGVSWDGQWRTVVNAVMNLRVKVMRGEFLD